MRKIKVIFDRHDENYPLLPNDSERAWDVFKNYIPEYYRGNVDLWNRYIISPAAMRAAGYDEFDGDYATLYSCAEIYHDMMIIFTPIDAEGHVYSRAEMEEYLLGLGLTVDEVFENDKDEETGRNLVLECFDMSDYRNKRDAIAFANRFKERLYQLSCVRYWS
jgi:hypothetical protein